MSRAFPFLNKVIQTEFDGYRFRSKLEARWALFFKLIGLEYEYEPEGFETIAGRYLPDFKLMPEEIYIEIKQSLDTDDFAKIFNLSNDLPIITLIGRPDCFKGFMLLPDGNAGSVVGIRAGGDSEKVCWYFELFLETNIKTELPWGKRMDDRALAAAKLCKSVRFEKGKAKLFPSQKEIELLNLGRAV